MAILSEGKEQTNGVHASSNGMDGTSHNQRASSTGIKVIVVGAGRSPRIPCPAGVDNV